MSKVYIAGPMRGIPEDNYPAFHEATARFRAAGWDVTSPAEMDLKEPCENPRVPACWRIYARRDLDVLLSFRAEDDDAVALLPGWAKSIGASAEARVARWLGLRLIDAATMEPLEVER